MVGRETVILFRMVLYVELLRFASPDNFEGSKSQNIFRLKCKWEREI